MLAFRVSGSAGLLSRCVAAFLRDAYPESSVELKEPEENDSEPSVRVDLDGTGRWLFISTLGHGDEGAAEALSSGACAVLTTDSKVDDLTRAFHALLTGESTFVPIEMMRSIAVAAVARRTEESMLTAREREVLHLVARGYTNTEIADQLVISTNTVRSHLHALAVKLKASSRTKMLANARALAIGEAFETEDRRDAERISIPA